MGGRVIELLINILFVFTPAFVAGMVVYSLCSIYQTWKESKIKPRRLELALPTHLGFKIIPFKYELVQLQCGGADNG